jgi:hypothetical protein
VLFLCKVFHNFDALCAPRGANSALACALPV